MSLFFFFNDTATTEIYTLSLHDALPISIQGDRQRRAANAPTKETFTCSLTQASAPSSRAGHRAWARPPRAAWPPKACALDRKSTRLNSSHSQISYAVFCLKKKNKIKLANKP